MKAPREGSRKASVYDVFHDKGDAAALKAGVKLGLAPGTIKSWCKGWAGHAKQAHAADTRKGPKGPRAASPDKVSTPKAEVRAAYDPRFDYTSRADAVKALMNTVRRMHCMEQAFHVIEENERFAVVPAHYKPEGKPPQFEKGDTVFDTIIPNSRGVVKEAGPYQCAVEYAAGYHAGREQIVPNVYLVKMEPVKAEPKAKPKAKRAAIKRK